MKILYNHQAFHQKYGGISRYFVELANSIALYKNKETSVKIISPFFKTDYLSSKNQKFLLSGLKLPDFKGSARLCSILNSFLSPILSKYYEPNIIHDTYYNYSHISNIAPYNWINTNITISHEETISPIPGQEDKVEDRHGYNIIQLANDAALEYLNAPNYVISPFKGSFSKSFGNFKALFNNKVNKKAI